MTPKWQVFSAREIRHYAEGVLPNGGTNMAQQDTHFGHGQSHAPGFDCFEACHNLSGLSTLQVASQDFAAKRLRIRSKAFGKHKPGQLVLL